MQRMNKTNIYQERRIELAKLICGKTGGGIAVVTTAPETARNRDSEFPYRHDSDFFYLTGFDEPGATLVLQVDRNAGPRRRRRRRPRPELGAAAELES